MSIGLSNISSSRNNKFSQIRQIVKCKMFVKKCFKLLFKILKVVAIIIIWGLLYLLLTVFTYDEYNSTIPMFLVIFIYFILIQDYYRKIKNYDDWCKTSQYDEFYKRFCRKYYPCIWSPFIVYAISLKFCNSFEFLLSIMLILSTDTNDRRFYTNETNLEMIREKLKKEDK